MYGEDQRDEREDEQQSEYVAVPLVVSHPENSSSKSPTEYAGETTTRAP